jgi:hypothetical protein
VTSYDDHEGKSIGISHFFEPFYHLPEGKSTSSHHTLSELYSHLQEEGLHNVKFCEGADDDDEETVCFRHNTLKKLQRKSPFQQKGTARGKSPFKKMKEEKTKAPTPTKRRRRKEDGQGDGGKSPKSQKKRRSAFRKEL